MSDEYIRDWPSAYQFAPIPATAHQHLQVVSVSRPWLRGNAVFTGPAVTISGVVGVARIALFDSLNMDLLDMVYSAPNGTWVIAGWNPTLKYVTAAFDPSGAYQPIAYDQV